VKDIAYPTKIRDITVLKQKSSDAIATTHGVMLRRTRQEIEYRLDVLHAIHAVHFEMYEMW